MKKTFFRRISALFMILCMGFALSACDKEAESESRRKTDTTTETPTPVPSNTDDNNGVKEPSGGSGTSAKTDASTIFTSRDLEQSPDLSDAAEIVLKDGETVSVTKDGTYHVTGTATNCTIRIEADDKAKVQLVLDGVSITNADSPAIYVVSADKCLITSLSSNELSVTGSFRADGETNTDAVIFSKDDLVLNGTGSLSVVSAYGNGISCKDDLKVTGGTYNLNTALDGLEANDTISICDGTFTITTRKDGMHCENDSDDTLGSIYISGGSFTIDAKSDAIQGTTTVVLDGGTYNLKGREGIEGTYITVNDGTITITATDDGINAPKKSTVNGTPAVIINGGTLNVTVGQGDTDAIDSNGDVYINGGTISITSTVSSIDYEGKAELNGGTLIINGEQVDSIPKSMFGGPGGGFPGQGQGRPGGGMQRPDDSDGNGFPGKRGRSEDGSSDFSSRPDGTDFQFPSRPEA